MEERAELSEWRALYAAADALRSLYPWIRFNDRMTVRVRTGEKSRWFVFAGNGKPGMLYCIYNEDGLRAFREALSGNARPELQHLRDETAVFFGTRAGLTQDDMDVMTGLGINSTKTAELVYFRRWEGAYAPSALSRDEVLELTGLMAELLCAAEDWLTGKTDVTWSLGGILIREPNENGAMHTSSETLVLPGRDYSCDIFNDELLFVRYLKKPLVDARLELDLFTLPTAAEDPRCKRAFFPRMALLADSASGRVVMFEVITPADSEVEKTLRLLMKFIETYGRPLIIYVQSHEAAAMISEFSRRSMIPYERVNFLPAVNDFRINGGINELCGG